MKKVTYTVVCPYNKEHTFPVVLQLEDESRGAESTFEVYCPFCDKYVQASLKAELKPDQYVYRLFGFKKRSSHDPD